MWQSSFPFFVWPRWKIDYFFPYVFDIHVVHHCRVLVKFFQLSFLFCVFYFGGSRHFFFSHPSTASWTFRLWIPLRCCFLSHRFVTQYFTLIREEIKRKWSWRCTFWASCPCLPWRALEVHSQSFIISTMSLLFLDWKSKCLGSCVNVSVLCEPAIASSTTNIVRILDPERQWTLKSSSIVASI